jgi:hypothetical protein
MHLIRRSPHPTYGSGWERKFLRAQSVSTQLSAAPIRTDSRTPLRSEVRRKARGQSKVIPEHRLDSIETRCVQGAFVGAYPFRRTVSFSGRPLGEGNIMSEHRYRVGQSVTYLGRERATGTYKITQLMPSEGGDFQYRIRNASEPHDRVVKESDLDRAA